jgi:hypothetical protein
MKVVTGFLAAFVFRSSALKARLGRQCICFSECRMRRSLARAGKAGR